MHDIAYGQPFSSLCYSNPSSLLYIVAGLICSLTFTSIYGFEFSSLVVSVSVMFLSTVALSYSVSRKGAIGDKQSTELETVADSKQNEVTQVHEYEVESEDYPPDSESSDDLSTIDENLELNWFGSNLMNQTTAMCSVSDDHEDEDEDEDSLIEISLPEKKSDCEKVKQEVFLCDYLPDPKLRQHDLVEFFEDIDIMNEEESLIEIDISMGSIKC